MSVPANSSSSSGSSPIAGSVLPISRAEELLSTLPGVISVRIVAGASGAVEEIHVLTSDEVAPKATVRNVESALMAHLGMRVSHKKISVATTRDTGRRVAAEPPPARDTPRDHEAAAATAAMVHEAAMAREAALAREAELVREAARIREAALATAAAEARRRRLYFEDIEVRRSRSQGVTCRVTLRKGDSSYTGEAEGVESQRVRLELGAQAALAAIMQSETDELGTLGLEGCKVIGAFDHEFVFVGITARFDRETVLMTGSAEVKETLETAAVLAVLDATNRWVEYGRQ